MVVIPSEGQEAARDLVRAREDVRGDLMRGRHRLSKLLLRQGIVYEDTAWTTAHWKWLRSQSFDKPGVQFAFDEAYDTVLTTLARRDRLDTAILTMAAEPAWAPVVTRLGCLRGVATLTGFGLAVEIGDWHRFTGNSIGSFLGLTPSEHSSGGGRSVRSFTKIRNGHARRLLVESSWHHRKPYRLSAEMIRRRDGQSSARCGPAADQANRQQGGARRRDGVALPTGDLRDHAHQHHRRHEQPDVADGDEATELAVGLGQRHTDEHQRGRDQPHRTDGREQRLVEPLRDGCPARAGERFDGDRHATRPQLQSQILREARQHAQRRQGAERLALNELLWRGDTRDRAAHLCGRRAGEVDHRIQNLQRAGDRHHGAGQDGEGARHRKAVAPHEVHDLLQCRRVEARRVQLLAQHAADLRLERLRVHGVAGRPRDRPQAARDQARLVQGKTGAHRLQCLERDGSMTPTAPQSMSQSVPSGSTRMFPGCGSAWKMPWRRM